MLMFADGRSRGVTNEGSDAKERKNRIRSNVFASIDKVCHLMLCKDDTVTLAVEPCKDVL